MTLRSVSSHPKDGDNSPSKLLSSFDALNAAVILSAAADITLVLNAEGIICERVIISNELPAEPFGAWQGKSFADVTTVESHPKITQMMQDAVMGLPPRWRQLNHQVLGSADIPVRYCMFKAGPHGHFVVVGRELRNLAAMQQKLLAAEQSIEQEYARLRHAETRYRLLLQVASEAILVVDSRSGRIIEANAAAANLLGKPVKRLTGAAFDDMFEGDDVMRVETLMMSLKARGRADDVALLLPGRPQQAVLSSTVFRQENSSYFLMRLQPMSAGTAGVVVNKAQSAVVKLVQDMPDGFVVTDLERRIISVNAAFLDSAQLGSEEQARGELLERWLGRAGVDVNVLFNSVAENGAVRHFQTIMRGQFGTVEDVEVSGVSAADSNPPCYGFTIRRLARRTAEPETGSRSLMRSVEEMTKLVGKVPLKDLVRETTDIIERLCIEAALQLNDNNRASAADMLGLSRQSLYVKLHRYGIEDKDGSGDA